MNLDDAVALIKGRLARWNDTVLTTYIKMEIAAAQRRQEMVEPLPWFLLTESSYATTTVGDERVEIPDDFIREADEDALWIEDSDGVYHKLRKDDYDAIRSYWTETGQPLRYALVGSYFRLRPEPDAVYTVHMIYFGKDSELSDGSPTNKWLDNASEVLIADAGRVVASRYVRNDAAAAEFEKDLVLTRRALDTMTQARLDASRSYVGDD